MSDGGAHTKLDKTFEMLWDCPQCETKKLLGKTHRHCPSCGAAQDPSKRYFPSPGEAVTVEGHVWQGVDRTCPFCDSPNAGQAKFCVNCGGGLTGAAEVERQPTAAASAGGAPRRVAPKLPVKRRPRRLWILWVVLGIAAVAAAALLVKRPVEVEVVSHTWSRSIDIERYQTVSDGAWCDGMPGDARSVHRESKVRSHRQVADGQDCTTKNVDNGDGTFHRAQDCKTRYRSEPVEDMWCTFTVDRWKVGSTPTAAGVGLEPSWPLASPRTCVGEQLGCERLGGRRETLRVVLRLPEGEQDACELDERPWRALTDGGHVTVKQRVVTGGIDCSSVAEAAGG